MFKKPNCPVIAIEEHYWDAELAKTYTGVEAGRPGPQPERLFDLGALRLKEMDEAGIDMQVISHGAPSAQKLTGDGAVALVRGVNDRLAAACAANPEALRRLRRAADRRPEGRRRRAGALRHQARLQGRDAARPRQRRVPRRQAVLADLRARRAARRADLLPSRPAARARDGGLLQRLRQGLPDGGARRLGLHGRDRDHRDPHGAVRRVRQAPEAQGHHRPPRRDAAVPGLARRPRHRAAGRGASRSASATSGATTSGSPPAATSPTRR